MFHYFEARMAVLLSTTTRLLRTALRHVMKDLREEQELVLKTRRELSAAEETGMVEEVKTTVKELEAKFEKIEEDLVKDEQKIFMAEIKDVEALPRIEELMGRILSVINELSKRYKNKFPVIETIAQELEQASKELRVISEDEQEELAKEYRAIFRELEEKEGVAQSLVIALNNVQRLVNDLRKLRGESRREKREEKKIEKEEAEVYALLKKLLEEEEEKRDVRDTLTKLQEKSKEKSEELAETIRSFSRLFKEVEHQFTIVLKVCSEIYFKFKKDNEDLFKGYLSHLEKTGFPQEDLKGLQELMKKEDEKVKESLSALLDVVRRGARLALKEGESAA